MCIYGTPGVPNNFPYTHNFPRRDPIYFERNWKIGQMFLLYHLYLQNLEKIKDLYYQPNVQILSFCDLKLYRKNKFT